MTFSFLGRFSFAAERIILLLSILWLFGILAGWDLFQWVLGLRNHYGFYSSSGSVFSDFTSWLPLSYRVSQGNLFPIQPSIDGTAIGFGFYPYLSLWLHGLLIAIFGVKGSYFIGSSLFPVCSFILLFFIFRRNLSTRWSVGLGFLSLLSFSSLPFRSFIVGLLEGKGWHEMGGIQILEIAHVPFPAFTLVAFLAVFYITTWNRRFTFKWLSFITLLWALQSQVHIINAVVGLMFWFLSFPVILRRQNPSWGWINLANKICIQGLISFVCLIPAVWSYIQLIINERFNFISLGVTNLRHDSIFGAFYFLVYFVMPVAIIIVTYIVQRVDWFELVYKFWPIYVLLVIEFILVVAPFVFKFAIPPRLLFERLAMFFLHFYYFVPIVYYYDRPPLTFHHGVESGFFTSSIRSAGRWFFKDASKAYLPILILALSFFAFSSIRWNFNHRKNIEAPQLEIIWKKLAELTKGASPGSVLLSDDPALNLLLPVASDHGTLWVNRVSNRISVQESISRLALHARVFGWSEEQFVRFMMPGTLQESNHNRLINLSKNEIHRMGVGYWLAMHRTNIGTEKARKAYEKNLRVSFRELDISVSLMRFKVTRIFASGDISNRVPFVRKTRTPFGIIYKIPTKIGGN